MRFALAQINPLIGDLQGNSQKILAACHDANQQGANLLLTPELSLWGYPPKDLLFNQTLLTQQIDILNDISDYLSLNSPELGVLVGIAEAAEDSKLPNLYNSIVLVDNAGWKVISRKQLLPTYDVFDEKRYFRASNSSSILKRKFNGETWKIGITICEDLWVEEKIQGKQLTGPDPLAKLENKGIDLIVNLSASPFSHFKQSLRYQLASKAVNRLHCPLIYINQTGGNDELIFDGGSFVLNKRTELVLKLPNCKEAFTIWDPKSKEIKIFDQSKDKEEQLFEALVMGVHDYAKKCNFNSALIGLSGGIDSALVAVIASAALGANKVKSLLMPSPWSSTGSIVDSENLAKRLGFTTDTIPINNLMKGFDIALKEVLGESPQGVTAENLQSRIRGTLLMAVANQKGHLLLSTGNKSELAVGYCTLYGDMNGGLSVIGDLYKTSVFALCDWLDSNASLICRKEMGLPRTGELIGKKILEKAPSAELRPEQKDIDSLPEYAILDPILKAIIEDKVNPQELINKGHEKKLINKIQKMLKYSEFKRRQAPPLLKVSYQAFGSGWRLPIASG